MKMYFSVEGEFITNIAREKLFMQKDLASAIRILRLALISDELSSDEQLMLCLKILHGAAAIKGNSNTEDYGIEIRDDIETRPTDLSSIAALISDMADENERLKKENYEEQLKFSFLASRLKNYEISLANADYYNETGKPLFSDIAIPAWAKKENKLPDISDMLDDFLAQRNRENELIDNGKEPVCDYGWLEPDGTWHPVEWGEHFKWANDWLNENMPFKDHADIYWHVDMTGKRHHIVGGDVLIYSLGWILLDNPYQGLAKMRKDPMREMTKAQKEFLFDYYIERGRNEEANALYED